MRAPKDVAVDPLPEPPMSCPGCGSERTLLPVHYGPPDPQVEERARRGEVVLGGCSGWAGSPRWECLVCGAGVGRRDRPWPPRRRAVR